MKPVTQIDSLVLKMFQSVADWFQSWFGADNFYLSKASLASVWLFIIVKEAAMMNDPKNASSVIFTLASFVPLTLILLPMVLHGERSRRNNPMFRNPSVQTLLYLRVFQLPALILICADIASKQYLHTSIFLSSIMAGSTDNLTQGYKELAQAMCVLQSLAVISFLYFGSCTPKPPTQGKISKWLASLATPRLPA